MNSFVDTFERILLVGEIGLVGLYTLGLYPGLVERSNKNVEEYAKLKDFMLEVFKKAANKKCRLILPTDFICAQKSSLEDIGLRNSGGADSKVGGANDGQGLKPPDNTISNKSIEKNNKEILLSEI